MISELNISEESTISWIGRDETSPTQVTPKNSKKNAFPNERNKEVEPNRDIRAFSLEVNWSYQKNVTDWIWKEIATAVSYL